MQQAKMENSSEPVLQKTKSQGDVVRIVSVVHYSPIEIPMSFSCWQSEEHSPQPNCLKDRLLQW